MDAKHPILFFPRGISRPRSRSDGCTQRNRPAKCTFLFSLHLVESNNEVFLLVQWQSWGIGPTDLPASSSLSPQPCTPFRSHVREGPALLEPLLHCPSGPPLVHTDSRGGGVGGMGRDGPPDLPSCRCPSVLTLSLCSLGGSLGPLDWGQRLRAATLCDSDRPHAAPWPLGCIFTPLLKPVLARRHTPCLPSVLDPRSPLPSPCRRAHLQDFSEGRRADAGCVL